MSAELVDRKFHWLLAHVLYKLKNLFFHSVDFLVPAFLGWVFGAHGTCVNTAACVDLMRVRLITHLLHPLTVHPGYPGIICYYDIQPKGPIVHTHWEHSELLIFHMNMVLYIFSCHTHFSMLYIYILYIYIYIIYMNWCILRYLFTVFLNKVWADLG